jgi:hypothetical protein
LFFKIIVSKTSKATLYKIMGNKIYFLSLTSLILELPSYQHFKILIDFFFHEVKINKAL